MLGSTYATNNGVWTPRRKDRRSFHGARAYGKKGKREKGKGKENEKQESLQD